jgi:hypothetical protein
MERESISKNKITPRKKADSYSSSKKKIYRIVWRDAYSEVDEWHDESSLDTTDYLCETIGYLMENGKNSKYYTIASTVTIEGYFCCLINIPKAMVVSKQKITLQ